MPAMPVMDVAVSRGLCSHGFLIVIGFGGLLVGIMPFVGVVPGRVRMRGGAPAR